MSKTRIATTGAPAAMGPYSQAIDTGSIVFCAGQVGLDPETGVMVEGGVEAQTERALTNLGNVLAAAGLGYGDVVKTLCFLADMGDFQAFNGVYARFFTEPYPARSTVAVKALPGAFAQGADAQGTRALPAIWTNASGFAARVAAFQTAVDALVEAARGGDMAAIEAAQGAVQPTCGACHMEFRAPAQ